MSVTHHHIGYTNLICTSMPLPDRGQNANASGLGSRGRRGIASARSKTQSRAEWRLCGCFDASRRLSFDRFHYRHLPSDSSPMTQEGDVRCNP